MVGRTFSNKTGNFSHVDQSFLIYVLTLYSLALITLTYLSLFYYRQVETIKSEMWLDSHAKKIKYDISNQKSYNDIANGWGCGDEWNITKEENVSTE